MNGSPKNRRDEQRPTKERPLLSDNQSIRAWSLFCPSRVQNKSDESLALECTGGETMDKLARDEAIGDENGQRAESEDAQQKVPIVLY
jgi:hypothetical protein